MKTDTTGLTTDFPREQIAKIVGKTIERVEFANKPLPNDPRGGSRDFAYLYFTDGTSVMFKIGAWGLGTPPTAPLHLAMDVVPLDEHGESY